MLSSWTSVQRKFKDAGSISVDVFTSDKRGDFQRSFILLLTCSLCSLLLSSLLLLYLHYSLSYELAVAGGITGSFGTLLTVGLVMSKRVRCFGTLLVISVFMKKSRNLLLTAGTSLVVLRNVRNTSENLSLLLKSMICNLKAKKAAIITSLNKYYEVLSFVADMLKWNPDLPIVKLTSKTDISARLESRDFEANLTEAEHKLNETVRYVQSVMHNVSSVSEKLFPAISFLVLTALIVLHVKKFHEDMKYKNKLVSDRFVQFDEKRRAEGKPHVLPLTAEEEKLYSVASIRPTFKDRRAMLKFSIPVVSHFVIWVVFLTVDTLVYWFVAIITTKLSELEPFHVGLLMNINVSVLKVTFLSFQSDNLKKHFSISFQDIVSVLGIQIPQERHKKDFSYSLTLFEKECLSEPRLLLHTSIIPLAVIFSALVVMILMAAKVAQLRLLVCEWFFSAPAEARVEYLHAKILKKRLKWRPLNVNSPYSKVGGVDGH